MRPSFVQCAGSMCLVLSAAAVPLLAASPGSYAQEEEVVVIWMIEGQPDYEVDADPEWEEAKNEGEESAKNEGEGETKNEGEEGAKNADDDRDVVVIIEGLLTDPEKSSPIDTPEIQYDHFVTGNRYAIGDHLISIYTEEGQILNHVLIDQKEVQTDNFRHKIKYYDRFSDGYVEIAEALLDPLGKQMYFSRGSVSDRYPNSNLELFVLERGYSLDNLQAVPNYIFSPMEFTYGRALLEDLSGVGGAAGDLRAYSPNYAILDEAELQSRMTESLSAQTSEVLERMLFAPVEPEPEPELYALNPLRPTGNLAEEQPIVPGSDVVEDAITLGNLAEEHPVVPPRGVFDTILHVQPKFEDVSRVGSVIENRDVVPSSQPQLTVSQGLDPWYVMLLIVLAAAGLAALTYLAYRTRRRRATVIVPRLLAGTVTPEPVVDYRTATRNLLSKARDLYDAEYHKEAHEVLGRAIRLFYSHKINARGLLTNEELLMHMRHWRVSDSSEYKSVARWLVVCGSVEYARYGPDAEEFAGVLADFSNVVGFSDKL